MPKVFVCYSHCDRRWVDRSPGSLDSAFVPWLRDRLRHDNIEVWSSGELDNTVVDAADREIARAIATSDMALVLVSDDFFISDHIVMKELPAIRRRADRGEMQVFPVVVAPVLDWDQSDAAWIYGHGIHRAAATPLATVVANPGRWEQVRSGICGALAARLLTPRPTTSTIEVPEIVLPAAIPPPPPPKPAFGPAALLEELRRREEAHRQAEEAARKAAEAKAEAARIAAEAARKAAAALLGEAKEAFRICTEIDSLESATPEEKAGAWEEYLRHYESRGHEVQKARARIAFWRAPNPGELRTLALGGGVTMNFRWCPRGKFTMGTSRKDSQRCNDEGPVEVTLTNGFWMGETPVTQAQYLNVMGSNPAKYKGHALPVESVSWDEAVKFCRRISSLSRETATLPTEAQWEYACRAGTRGRFHTGDLEMHLGSAGWYAGNSGGKTKPVGLKEANAWGLRDMHGNVWEWCADWYAPVLTDGIDPRGISVGATRVRRGGSWNSSAQSCRCSHRYYYAQAMGSTQIGFRVALVV